MEIATDGDDEKGPETRGKILQRHKREWKSLRAKLNDMKAHKKAMGHGTLAKKGAKKDVAIEIKALEEAMRFDFVPSEMLHVHTMKTGLYSLVSSAMPVSATNYTRKHTHTHTYTHTRTHYTVPPPLPLRPQ